jgi:hypothetical protein
MIGTCPFGQVVLVKRDRVKKLKETGDRTA